MDSHRFVELNTLPLALRLGHYGVHLIYWGFYATEWWRNYLHIHSFFETCYVYAGRGTFVVEGVPYTVGVGDIFVAPPTLAHEIISSTDAPLGIYFWAHTLQRETGVTKPTSLDGLFEAFGRSKRYVSQRTATLQSTIDLLTDEIIHKPAGYRYSIEALATKLILDSARAVSDPAAIERPTPEETEVQSTAARTSQTMLHYLHDNYDRPLALRDVSAQVHLSERHANRLFKQHTGVSIAAYIRAYRLRMASTLLLDPACSIKEITLRCGFSDVHYFTTAFHRQFGITPDKFRRQAGTQFLPPVSS